MKQIRYLILLFAVFIHYNSFSQVCSPSRVQNFNKCCGIGLQNLYIGNQKLYDSLSYSVNGIYTDSYDTVSTSLSSGVTYTFKLSTQTYNHAICLWVDWNKNDTFESSEINYSNTSVAPAINTFPFIAKSCNDSFRVRLLVDYYYYYNQAGVAFDPCKAYYGDFLDFKIYTLSSANNDIALTSINNANILNYGYNHVSITMKNFGDTTIDSARVYYQVNGGSIISENITGMNLAACDAYNYTFNDSFNASNGGYNIKAWVKYPNGNNPDAITANDTANLVACVALSGNYTINGAQSTGGSNFKNLKDVAQILNNCGISGPVTFTMASGTYTADGVTFSAVNGSSSTNTITFDGVDTTNRIVTSNSSDLIIVNAAQYITFRNIAFKPAANVSALILSGECSYITIDSCSFKSTTSALAGAYVIPRYKNNSAERSSYITFSNNVFSGTTYGILLEGGYNNKGIGNLITNNIFKTCNYSIMSYYQDTMTIKMNSVRNSLYYGIYLYDVDNTDIYRNDIFGNTSYLMILNNLTNGKVYNNLLSGENNSQYCMQLSSCVGTSVYHNTVYMSNNSNAYAAYVTTNTNLDIRNNIFSVNGGNSYPFYSPTANQYSNLEFNQYYNTGGSKYVFLSTDFANIAAVKGQFGFNNFSTGDKPNFVSTSSTPRNIHLVTNLAPMYGDFNVGLTDDVDGDSRCTIAPTVGADESKYTQGKPVSKFTCLDTAFINSPIIFTNGGAFNEGKQFEWYADTATVPTAITQNLTYTFSSNGTFDVRLKTFNCSYSHDTTKSIVIVTPTKAPVTNFVANTTSIDPGENVKLTDLTTGGATSWNWSITGGTNQGVGIDFDYINGTDSTSQHPEVTFYLGGNYDVCLSTTNAAGSSQACKSAYIKVYAVATMCGTTNISDMFGHFYDEGGKFNNYPYANNKSCNLLISPCSGAITLTFTSNNFDSTIANLKIYDGLNASGKLLTKNHIKAGNKFVANSGNMYIEWNSQWGSYPGWEATWTTAYKFIPKAPATMITLDTAYENCTHDFSVKYYQAGVQYDWDFDNDGTIDNTGRDVSFTYVTAGNYDAVCYATSCGGIDTVTRPILVTTPSNAPDPVEFALDATGGSACQVKPQNFYVVEAGITALLYDKSGNGPTAWEWNIVNSTGTYSWDNGNNIQNPSITFFDTGHYSIELKVTNNVGTSTKVFSRVIRVVDAHCQPTVTNISSDFGITEFTFNDIVSKSNYNTYYSDYTSTYSTCVESGNRYSVSVKRQSNGSNCKIGIWIDYNQDGDFLDAGELVKINNSFNGLQLVDTNIKIPALSGKSVLFGRTVMRVGVVSSANQIYNCGTNNYGEFEDYAVFITDDRTPPTITLIGKDTVTSELGLTYKDPGAKAVDNLDGVIAYTITGSINTQVQGYYTIRYDASDKAGNDATPKYRVVNVTGDNSAPVITILGKNPAYHDVNTAYIDAGATAYDSADGVVNISNTINLVNSSVLGTYTVKYFATDSHGNTDSATRTVYVVDSLAPVITLNGNDTLYLSVNTGYNEPGYTVVDNYDPNPSVSVTPSNIDTTKIQTVMITYKAQDSYGNKSETYRWIIFEDNLAPTITLNGNDTIYVEVKGTYNELGAIVKDNYDKNPQLNITGGPVNTNVLGTTIIFYTASDAAGNISVEKRYVIVRKTTKPSIVLVGNSTINLFTGATYNDQGVTFTDAFYTDSDLRPKLKTGTNFPNPSNTQGTFTTWFHVVDPSGNASDTTYRTIVVQLNGISKVNTNNNLELYPNPTNNILHINGLPTGTNFIQVMDLNGKVIYQNNVNNTQFNLTTTEWPAGLYIIRTSNGNDININRFEVIK